MVETSITPPSKIQQTFTSQLSTRQPEAIAQLTKVYRELFGESVQQGCGNCYQKAYFRIQKFVYLHQLSDPFTSNTATSKPIRKYLLKPTRSLQTTFGGDTLTNDNLTDEAAEKLLKAYPALIKHFEKYPEKDVAAAPAEALNQK